MACVAHRTRAAVAVPAIAPAPTTCDCAVLCNGACGLTRRTCRCWDVDPVDHFCARCKTREEIPGNWCVWNREFPFVCGRCCNEIQDIDRFTKYEGLTAEDATAKAFTKGEKRQELDRKDYVTIFKKPFEENTAGAIFRAKGSISTPLPTKVVHKFDEERFLEECTRHKSYAEGPSPRTAKKTQEGPAAEAFRGTFEMHAFGREIANDYWNDSFCQVCDKKNIPSNYEIHFRLGGEDPPGRAYFCDLLDVCRACVHSALTRTDLFEDGDKAWESIEEQRPLGGEFHRLPCEVCGEE